MKAPAGLLLFMGACLAAAWIGRLERPDASVGAADGFPGWPSEFEGQPLRPCALSEGEMDFTESFPGRMGRFTDGGPLVVFRWVTAPTHKVHSAADCLRSAGWRLEPGDWRRDPDGSVWSTWTATRAGRSMTLRERCHDGRGASWPDVSSWFWSATFGKGGGPWWIVSVAEY